MQHEMEAVVLNRGSRGIRELGLSYNDMSFSRNSLKRVVVV